MAVALAAGYALVDEGHQMVAPGQVASVRDAVLDTSGCRHGSGSGGGTWAAKEILLFDNVLHSRPTKSEAAGGSCARGPRFLGLRRKPALDIKGLDSARRADSSKR